MSTEKISEDQLQKLVELGVNLKNNFYGSAKDLDSAYEHLFTKAKNSKDPEAVLEAACVVLNTVSDLVLNISQDQKETDQSV